MLPPTRTMVALVVVALMCAAARTARGESLRLPALGVEIESAPGWTLDPASAERDGVVISGGTTILVSARPGAVCAPAVAPDRVPSCPADVTCTVAPRGASGRIGYCAAVPGGVFEATTTADALAQPALAADVTLVVQRTWKAIALQRTTTPWVRRAPVSGLELAIPGDASWAFVPDQTAMLFGKPDEPVDMLRRLRPTPGVDVEFVRRGRDYDCATLRRTLGALMKPAPTTDWPAPVTWVLAIEADRLDRSGTTTIHATCIPTPTGSLLMYVQADVDASHLDVVRALIAASGAGATVATSGRVAAISADATTRSPTDAPTSKSLHMGRFFLQGFGLRTEGADDRYGGRIGLDLWVNLDEERWLSPIFAFGLSGSASNKVHVGFDTRLALGGGIRLGPLALAVLGTAGVDRVTPIDGVTPYAGLEALIRIPLGIADLDAAAQWNTSETRGFLQVVLPAGFTVGAEWIQYRDATLPADLLGLYIGASPR